MTAVNPVKQYLEYIGIKQKYHEPVLEKEKRFYLIEIDKIQIIYPKFKQTYSSQSKTSKQRNIKQPQKQSHQKNNVQNNQKDNIEEWEGRVTFQVGCRSSHTDIHFDQDKLKTAERIVISQKASEQTRLQVRTSNLRQEAFNKQKKDEAKFLTPQMIQDKRINTAISHYKKSEGILRDMHIFPFQKQQVMTIRFQVVQSAQSDSKEYYKQYGYAIIPLVPFLKMPYTKHEVEIDLVFENQKRQIRKEVMAKIDINLYFMHNFKARFFFQVVKADLERNLAFIGQMYPIIRMYARDSEYQTDVIQQGGIKPHWKSQKQGEFCYFNIPLESVSDDLFIYLFYNRQVTIDEVVGRFKIDLQEQTMFKRGANIDKFIIDAIKNINDQAKESQREIKKKQVHKETKIKKIIEKDLRQSNDELIEEFFEKLKTARRQIFSKNIQILRRQIITALVYKTHTLSPNRTIQILEEFCERIEKQQSRQLDEIERKLKGQFSQLITESPEPEKIYCRQKFEERLGGLQARSQIMKLLVGEMKKLSKFIETRMIQWSIPLQYINPFPKNELDQERTVGRLEFRYLFLYEFQHQTPLTEHSDQNYFY